MPRTRRYSFDRTLPDGRVVSVCIPRMPHLRANITYRCDRGCPNCNRACGVAKSNTNEDMTPEQFKIALDDLAMTRHPLTKIILTGGEPSMHPELMTFADIAMQYKLKHNPQCRICISTYRHPKYFHKIDEILYKYPAISILGNPKSRPRIHIYAPYIAPIDKPNADPNHFYRGCHSNGSLCGMTVDYQGFWCCPVAPAISRVFGLSHIAIPLAKDISLDALVDQYKDVCSLCGYYHTEKAKGNTEPISPSWKMAIQCYTDSRPSQV